MTVEITAACPACGEPIVAGNRFCEACGNELPFTEPPAAPPTPVADADGEVVEAEAAVEPAAAAVSTVLCPSCGVEGEPMEGYCGSCGMRLPAPRDHQELVLAGAAGVTDKGKRHHRNEDAMAFTVGDGFAAAVVCDGVSTSQRPDDASQGAVDAALAVLVAAPPPAEPDLDGAYDAARRAVLDVAFQPHPELSPPSCTFLAAMITNTRATLAALGDCRAYWVAGGEVTQLTEDDSWATMQIASGAMTRAEAYADRMAHVITRWLAADADPDWRPAIVPFDIPGPGRLLLVSDGLWNYTLEPADLAAAIGDQPSEPIDLARRLVTFANESGGSDNITVVVVDLPLPGGTAPAEPAEPPAPQPESPDPSPEAKGPSEP